MFNVNTAYLLWTVQAGTLAVLLGAIWLHVPRRRYFLNFALGFLVQGLGLTLITMRGLIPSYISMQVGNGLTLLSYGFWAIALFQLAGMRPRLAVLAPTILWMVATLVPEIAGTFSNRATLFNIIIAGCYAILAWIIMNSGSNSRGLRQALCAIWLVTALIWLRIATITAQTSAQSYDELPEAIPLGLSVVVGLIASIGLITKLLIDRSEEYLQRLIRTDALTDILNRRGFIETFAEIKAANRNRLIAVAVFDLDHFKTVNDTYGHAAGDRALQYFADTARHLLPQGAVLGRTGGEEFSATIPVRQFKDALLYAETLRQTLAAKAVTHDASSFAITVSIGVSVAPAEESQLDRLMSLADKALYLAKEKGRNRIAIWQGDKPVCLASDETHDIDQLADRQVEVLNRLSATALRNLG